MSIRKNNVLTGKKEITFIVLFFRQQLSRVSKSVFLEKRRLSTKIIKDSFKFVEYSGKGE